MSVRRIVCAAIRHRVTGQIVIGVRHYDSIMRATIVALKGDTDDTWYSKDIEQGFVTNEYDHSTGSYKFVDRFEALSIALIADQRVRRCGGDEDRLYSENLY